MKRFLCILGFHGPCKELAEHIEQCQRCGDNHHIRYIWTEGMGGSRAHPIIDAKLDDKT